MNFTTVFVDSSTSRRGEGEEEEEEEEKKGDQVSFPSVVATEREREGRLVEIAVAQIRVIQQFFFLLCPPPPTLPLPQLSILYICRPIYSLIKIVGRGGEGEAAPAQPSTFSAI